MFVKKADFCLDAAMAKMILAGDIGGTKTHLALFPEKEPRKWVVDARFPSANYDNLRGIVTEFLEANAGHKVESACFGIAGPVQDRMCKATNLPWIVDAAVIEKETGIEMCSLINDLEANAFGIECLGEDELFVLNEGKAHRGNRALISAGTGLGEAGIFWDGEQHRPFACEGGHCTFSPETDLEIKLMRYLKKRYDHVSFERVLSGPGLFNIYQFLIDEGYEKELESVKEELEKSDPPKVITEMGMKSACPACMRSLDMFVSIFGSESANWALKMLAVGGLYIGGGIAPKILNELQEGAFMKRFIQKGGSPLCYWGSL